MSIRIFNIFKNRDVECVWTLKSKGLDFTLSEIDGGSTEILSEIMISSAQAWAELWLSLAVIQDEQENNCSEQKLDKL